MIFSDTILFRSIASALLVGLFLISTEECLAAMRMHGSWTEWSDWSECSRSCDGGITSQQRECISGSCEGSAEQYKICNMQPCTDNSDFRDSQCSEFDTVRYKSGDTSTWKSYHHPEQPCRLYCVNQFGDIELLASKVLDGTRCRPGSLEMCIDGECQSVGCDLEIGSVKTVDDCGICGGDGSSCTHSIYQWNENTNTTCSVKCGGGYKITQPVCQNTITGEIVKQELCDLSQMPQGRLLECHAEPCPPRWDAGEWSACSQSCGSGIRTRPVYCMEEQNKTKNKVFNHLCKGHSRPRMQESCNMQPCPPEWIPGTWSPCSVSCGQGIQTRNITCKTYIDTLKCNPEEKPPSEQTCFETSCSDDKFSFAFDIDGSRFPSFRDGPYQAEKLIGKQNNPSPHAVFVAEEWSSCSVTCGDGIRKRKVYCKAHLDYIKIMTKFEDDTCTGEKPSEIEPCSNKPCTHETIWDHSVVQDGYGQDSNEDTLTPKVAPGSYGKTYSWKKNGFTPCTATCLGGVQELIINCVRDEDQKVVSPYLCSRNSQPEVVTQTCNDHPCPPRWNVSDYLPCTKKCGMGIQIRDINCIHEVTISNTVLVPDTMCEQPAPPDRQHCNFIDCPVEWHVTNWTKCNKSCGGGEKKRDVECRQITAQNHVIPQPEHMCPSPKPQTLRPCNSKSCSTSKEPVVLVNEKQNYDQERDPGNLDISLKIGGQASIFVGTRFRIRCPVKRFNRGRIIWTKDHQTIFNSENHVLKKGILKIQESTYSDSGIYSCIAGSASGSMKIIIKPRPSDFPPSSEEVEKQNNQLDPAMTMKFSGNQRAEIADYEISHERLPLDENGRNTHGTKRRKDVSSTIPTSLQEDFYHPMPTEENPNIVKGDNMHEVVDSLLPSSSTSGASRLMPNFHSIFTNIKEEGNHLRNHRMLKEEKPPENQNEFTTSESFVTDNILGSTVILGKGDRSNVKFEWLITNWTNCSPPCGGPGFQVRSAHCMVKLNNVTQNVDGNLCEDAGFPAPVTIQKCDTEECPRWVTKEWQQCSDSRCFTWNTAMQRREIFCKSANGSIITDTLCDEAEKPTNKQECYNDLCKGTWKVGDWSECAAPCEKEGYKYRILQCVWYGTKKPAGTACRDQPRPSVMRACRGQPCPDFTECKDRSKYCQNVKYLNMCKSQRYKIQCCQTCKLKKR